MLSWSVTRQERGDTSKSVDLGRAFTFAFEDREWLKKFLFGGAAVLLAPALVGLLALLGYGGALFRAAREGRDELPSWDALGDYMANGVQGIVVFFAYTAPVWAAAVGASIISLAVASVPGDIPPWVGYCCSAPFALMVTLFVLFVTPMALARFYETGQMAAAFEFQKIMDLLRTNLALYLPVFATVAMSSVVVGTLLAVGAPLVIVLIGIPILAGGVFLGFLAWVAHIHAMAQIWRLTEATSKDGQAAPAPLEVSPSSEEPAAADDFSDLPEA